MTENDSNGGPAFPQPGTKVEDGDTVARSWDDPGMSLRDYFAAKAMAALIAKGPCKCAVVDGIAACEHIRISVVKGAYLYADEMLLERAE